MDSDESRYYDSQLLDASFLVLVKTEKSVAFIREWFLYCSQAQILTDHPNVCGHPNLPDFLEHRWDQSILSLLAAREKIELFRHPSQYGNHLKDEPYRQPDEWKRYPYGAKGIYYNSPYKTLLNHHRGNLGQEHISPISLRWTFPAPCHQVFYAWVKPEELKKWFGYPNYVLTSSEMNLCAGGKYRLTFMDTQSHQPFDVAGEYIEIIPLKRLVFSWPWSTRVIIDFHGDENATEVVVTHEHFSNERVRQHHIIEWNNVLTQLANVFFS
jgi:uncharacterized protein YndB with AHSA1/START domain